MQFLGLVSYPRMKSRNRYLIHLKQPMKSSTKSPIKCLQSPWFQKLYWPISQCRHRNFVKVAWHCFSLISPKLLTLLTSTYFSEPQIPNTLWPLNKKLKFQVASDSKLLPKLVNKNKPRKNTHNVQWGKLFMKWTF